ncbi:TonB family protein [Microbulbifer guangxiensis]|uniref:TonB family protein n=1 Tax=Microbulbifer guangxiensis TaxID=2904249 RepID=UPI001F1CE4E9
MVSIISTESDFCSKRILNPPHCQEDGVCYHFKKDLNYPVELLKRGIEGHAKVRFDTDSDGCTLNHRVLESYPESGFGEAAIGVLKKYQYSGQVKGLEKTFTYKIQK